MLGLPRYVVHGAGGGGNAPSLNFNFVDGSAFSPQITFTRASTATFFDSAGVLQSAAIDEPRIDYDPATLAARGLLIEEQRTNLLTYSEDFSQATWVKGLLTVSADVAVAPDGATTADKLIEDTSNGQHHIRQSSITVASGATVTVSVFAKAAERTTMQMYMNDSSTTANRVQADFDLSTGTTSAANNVGTFTGATSSITDVGNGWYRCVLTGVATGVTSVAQRSAIGTTNYTGDGTSGLFIWGAQLEAGAFPTSYIPTTTTALTRSADVASVNTLSPWYRADEGTLFASYTTFGSSGIFVYNMDNGSDAETLRLRYLSTQHQAFVLASSSTQAQIYDQTGAGNPVAKTALGYKINDFAVRTNGGTNAGAVANDNSGNVPTGLTTLRLGSSRTGALNLNGWLSRFTYYPRRLSNAQLQQITA